MSRQAGAAAGTRSHTTLAQLVDAHGAAVVIAAMEALPRPLHEPAQYIYGARNALRPIPSGREARDAAAGADDSERFRRRVERTKREAAEIQSVGKIVGSIADHGVTDPGTSS